MRYANVLPCLLGVLGWLAQPADSSIILSSGAVDVVTPGGGGANPGLPWDVSQGEYESDSVITAFNELQNHTLTADIAVTVLISNYIANGGTFPALFDQVTDEKNVYRGYLTQGTVVSSHYVFLDQDEAISGAALLTGSITFDDPIVGVLSNVFGTGPNFPGNEWQLSATELGLTGVTYWPVTDPGVEYSGTEQWQISSDLKTISFTLNVTSGQDNLRIITAQLSAVPEPASLAVWGVMGVLGLATVCVRSHAGRAKVDSAS